MIKLHIKLTFLIVGIIFIAVSCNKSYKDSVYTTNLKLSGKDVILKGNGIVKGDDAEPIDLKKIMYGNNYGYYFNVKYSSVLEFSFSDLILIKEISFEFKRGKSDTDNRPMIMKITIQPDKSSMPVDVIEYNIDNSSNIQKILFPKQSLTSLLKYKFISFDATWEKYAGIATGETVYLKNIKILFTDSSGYKPSISFTDLQVKCLSKRDKDNLITYDDDFININEITNIIYYSINKNKKAENILLNLNPTSAENGEFISNIIEWYKINNKFTQ